MPAKDTTTRKRVADDPGEGSSKTKKVRSSTSTSASTGREKDASCTKQAAKDAKDSVDRTRRTAKEAADRKRRIELSVKKNPVNVFVIGPPNNAWEDNSKKLAGYLHFDGPVEGFRVFLNGSAGTQESRDVANILAQYLAIRRSNYGKPETTLSRGKMSVTITTKALFETIDDTSNDITRLFQSDVTLPLPTKREKADDDTMWIAGTVRYALATTIKAMASLIAYSPTMFPTSHLPKEERLQPMGLTRYAAEDWHRAYQLLRFYFRQHSDIKKETNFFTRDQTDKGDAEEVFFYTADELEQTADANQDELDVAEGDDQGRVVGALIHEAQLSAPTAESSTTATIPDLEHDPVYWEKIQTEFEGSVEKADKETRTGNDLGSHGVHVKRSRLDKTNMRKLCIALGQECKIIHDDPTALITTPTTTDAPSDPANVEAVQAIASRGMNITDPINLSYEFVDGMDEAEKAKYWETQHSLSTVSAQTKSYEESCQLLGYDPDAPTPFPDDLKKKKAWRVSKDRIEAERLAAIEAGEKPVDRNLGPEPQALLLNGWQAIGAQWSIEQEEGPIGGGIVCDDCGTGKTIQMLVVIYEYARRMKAQHIAGASNNPRYRPTIVLAPAPVVDVWFDEINRWFPPLKAWRYFEQANKVNNAFMKERTLPTKAEHLVTWLSEHCPPDNPDSCSVVVISAYETFQIRTLVITTKDEPVPRGTDITTQSSNDLERLLDDDEVDNMHSDTDDNIYRVNHERYEYSSLLSGKFHRIVLDEAHKTRNPFTKTAEAIRRLEVDKKHLVTATPMLNRGVDFFGYLTVFWCPAWDVCVADESVGSFHFDYYDSAHLPQHTPAYQAGGEFDYAVHQLALWRLNPERFARAMNVPDHVTKCLNAYAVLRQVIPLLMLRRTQATTIVVNGVQKRIGDSIPPYRICTVELDWSSELEFQAYRRIFDRAIKYLYHGASNNDTGRQFTVPHSSHKGKSATKGNTGTRAFAIHRMLGILTFNPKLYQMLQRTAGRNLVTDVEEWYQRCADRGMSLYFEMTKPEVNLPLYSDRWSFARYICKDSPKLKYVAKLMGEICLSATDPRRVLLFTDWPMNQWLLEGFLSNIGFHVKSLRSSLDASERKQVIDDFNNPHSHVDGLLLSIKASGAGLNLHWSCSDIIITCVAENINMVLQALGRAHRIGQRRFQRVWIVTLDHSYDLLLQSAQTKKMLQQIAGEGLIDINVADYDVTDDQIAEATTGMTDATIVAATVADLKDRARERKGQSITAQAEAIITQMMGQRCSRAGWDDSKDLTKKDAAEEEVATPAKVNQPRSYHVPPIPFPLSRHGESGSTLGGGAIPSPMDEVDEVRIRHEREGQARLEEAMSRQHDEDHQQQTAIATARLVAQLAQVEMERVEAERQQTEQQEKPTTAPVRRSRRTTRSAASEVRGTVAQPRPRVKGRSGRPVQPQPQPLSSERIEDSDSELLMDLTKSDSVYENSSPLTRRSGRRGPAEESGV